MSSYTTSIATIRDLSTQLSTIAPSVAEGIHEQPVDRINTLFDFDAALGDFEHIVHSLMGAFRHLRNTLSSSSALPPEILTNIFKYNDVHATMQAAAVCRSWRVAAVNCSSLWTNIDLNDGKSSQDYARLLLSRSGNLPVTIGFASTADLYQQNLLDGSLFLRAQTIYNFIPHSRRSQYVSPHLKSLHVILSPDTQFHDAVKEHDQIQNLSITFRGRSDSSATPFLSQIDANYYGPRIRAMYLQRLKLSVPTLLEFLLEFTALQELFLEDCGEADSLVPMNSGRSRRRPLSFLHLKGCSAWFVDSFLTQSQLHGVTGTTNLFLESQVLPRLLRDHLAVSLRVSAPPRIFLYSHQEGGKTWIMTGPYMSLFCIAPYTIASVVCTGRYPLSANELGRFINLRELTFVFLPDRDPRDSSLERTLNSELISVCSQLSYLRLQLPMVDVNGVKSQPRYEDRAEEIVPSFLEQWEMRYHQRFGHVLVEDAVGPARWEALMDRLLRWTVTFEVKGVVEEEEKIELPGVRPFKPPEQKVLGTHQVKGSKLVPLMW